MNVNFLIFFGVILGAAGTLAVVHFSRLQILEPSVLAFSGGIIGSVIAVFSAWFVANHQIQVRRNELAEDRQRQQFSARARLPLDLSKIIHYTTESMQAAKDGCEATEAGRALPPGLLPCPELEPDVMLHLQRLTELLSRNDANQVFELMDCHQVQYARLHAVLKSLNKPERNPGLILGRHNFVSYSPEIGQ